MQNFYQINENANRYSVEVYYRTTIDEVVDSWSKLLLGFVSAAMKNDGYNVKRVFDEKPYRIIVSSNNFDDGEWVGVVTYNPEEGCYHISKGFYRKDTKNVVITKTDKCGGYSAAQVYKELKNFMQGIKGEKPHHRKLNPVKGQTGPKQGSMRAGQGLRNKGKTENDGQTRPFDHEFFMGI